MKTSKKAQIMFICTILMCTMVSAQELGENEKQNPTTALKTYVIERNIPNAGMLTSHELTAISQKSCSVIDDMGPNIVWMHSYVAENKVYCVYKAENKETIKEHAAKAGFPILSISKLSTKISPETAKDHKQ